MNAAGTITRDIVIAKCREFGWSQNELARRIRKDTGMVSKVLRGLVVSGVVWSRIERAFDREDRRRGATNHADPNAA